MNNTEEKGLRLLSLDGGGIRGLSTLLVLQSLMLYLQDKLDLPEMPLPCEFFDLVGGTSTGGLIALMIGRLRMPVEKAIEAYVELSKDVFSEKQFLKDGKYSAAGLEAAVGKIVEQYAGDTGSVILDSCTANELCRTFVCTVTAKNMNARITTLIRSYKAPRQLPIPCTIIEAARATTAAPTFFERAVIKVQGIDREYLDGGVAQNNPCDVVVKEAALVFPGRSIACIISIGTGKLPVIQLERPGIIGNMIPVQIAKVMAGIATDTEHTHQTLQRRFNTRPNVYFRFNVDEGMQDITLEEWNKLDDVASHAEKYLESEGVKQTLEGSVKVMVERKMGLSVSEAIGTVSAAETQHKAVERKHCPPPSRAFTGRADILSIMDKHFSSDSTNEQLMIVLYGLGGSGKSEIMRRFVADSQVQMEDHPPRFSEVLYVDASSAATLEVDLANISMDKNIGENAKDTISWLVRTRDRWLLILDNADDTDLDLQPFLPSCSHGNIIITTRNRQLEFYERSLEVSRMPKDDAKALFVRRSRISDPQEATRDNLITQIVEELDFLALAIVQAAAYLLVNKTCTLDQYLTRFLSDRRKILEKYKDFVHKSDDYEKTVYTTWNISLDQLQRTDPEAVTFLFICSFLHHKNIPQAMFINAASSASHTEFEDTTLLESVRPSVEAFLRPFVDPDAETSETFDQVVAALGSYSLVEITPEGNLSFHRLVHDWSRDCAQATEILYPIHAGLILTLSLAKFWTDLNTPNALAYTRVLLPHMNELQGILENNLNTSVAVSFQKVYFSHGWWQHAEKVAILIIKRNETVFEKEHPTTLVSMGNLASTYWNMGRWTEAEKLQVTVMETSKRVLGEEHPETLTSMGSLASAYWSQGRWTEAEKLQVTVMETRKRVLGEEHPSTLTSMGNLASIYSDQGRWTEAEKLQATLLETRKRVLGEEHPSTLMSMGHLALTYSSKGRWTEAEKLQVTLLETRKRVLSEEHPDTLMSMGNLALTYWNQGRWTEAEGLQVTVMETMPRMLGEEHPYTLKSMGNLASIYRDQGRWTEAEKLQVTLIETQKRVLGEEHSDTLMSMGNLASTYRKQGRWTEAEGLQVTVMETMTRVLGEEHPHTLMSMGNLALTYSNQGRWAEVEKLEATLLETRKRVLGEEHPDTLDSMGTLAFTYWNMGRWTEAENLGATLLETRKRVLGEEHPHTLTSMGNLAFTYSNQGRWAEAERMQVTLMETHKRVLGEEHSDTLMSMGNLASTYLRQRRWKEAEGLEVTVMETSKRVLGEEHPSTLTSMGNLALAYSNQGRWAEAERMQVTLMETHKRVLGEEHPHTLKNMGNLASTYWMQRWWKEAEGLQVTVMETSKRVLGEAHPDTLKSIATLAKIYRDQGKLEEAEKLEGTKQETEELMGERGEGVGRQFVEQ